MLNFDQILLVLSVVGYLYFLMLNFLVILLAVVCGMLMHDKWGKAGKGKSIPQSDSELRKKIAVAATLAAINIENNTSQQVNYNLPATALVSAWQAVMRSDLLRRQRTVR